MMHRGLRSASVKSDPSLTKDTSTSEDDDDDSDDSDGIELTIACRFDQFRTYLDFQADWWEGFRTRLSQQVMCGSGWHTMASNKDERRRMAQRFVNQIGAEYWGSEGSRKKFLLPRNIKEDTVFRYPENANA